MAKRAGIHLELDHLERICCSRQHVRVTPENLLKHGINFFGQSEFHGPLIQLLNSITSYETDKWCPRQNIEKGVNRLVHDAPSMLQMTLLLARRFEK